MKIDPSQIKSLIDRTTPAVRKLAGIEQVRQAGAAFAASVTASVLGWLAMMMIGGIAIAALAASTGLCWHSAYRTSKSKRRAAEKLTSTLVQGGALLGTAAVAGVSSIHASFWATLVSVAAVLVARNTWDHHEQDGNLGLAERAAKVEVQQSKVRLAELREQRELLKLERESNVPVDPVFPPGLAGAIQKAVWKLTSHVLPIVDLTSEETGWTAELQLVDGVTMRMLDAKADAIAETLALDTTPAITYGTTHDYVTLTYREKGEFPKAVGWTPTRSELPWDAPVQLGVDEYGNIVSQAFTVHAIIAGATGGGKSNCINLVCLQLAARRDVEVIGIDLKPGAPEMRQLMPILTDLGNSLGEAVRILDQALVDMAARGDIVSGAGTKKWDPSVHGGPVRYIVMDEYAELIRAEAVYLKGLEPAERRAHVSVKDKVAKLAALSRSNGIFLIMGTQTPDGSLFNDNTAVRTNFPIRIVFRLMERIHYAFVLPADGAWVNALSSKAPGRMVVYSADKYNEPGEYLNYRVADDPKDAALGLDPDQLRIEVSVIRDKREAWGLPAAEMPILIEQLPNAALGAVVTLSRKEAVDDLMTQLEEGPKTKSELIEGASGKVTPAVWKGAMRDLAARHGAFYNDEAERYELPPEGDEL